MATSKMGIGYSPLSDTVYMGKQNQEKGMWVGEKQNITSEFLAVALAFFSENSIREIGGEEIPNIVINIKKERAVIERTIKTLQKTLDKLPVKSQ